MTTQLWNFLAARCRAMLRQVSFNINMNKMSAFRFGSIYIDCQSMAFLLTRIHDFT